MNFDLIQVFQEYLGKNFELLDKPAIFLSDSDKWAIFQIFLFNFGADVIDQTILIDKNIIDEQLVDNFKKSIELLLNLKLSITSDEVNRKWLISFV